MWQNVAQCRESSRCSSPHHLLPPHLSTPTIPPPQSPQMSSYLLVRLHSTIMSAISPSTPKKKFYIGSRASKLALVQTNIVRDALLQAHPEFDFEIISMTTTGDNNQTTPLHSFGAKALWTQELEVLLLDNKLDMIVHSLKGPSQTTHPPHEQERKKPKILTTPPQTCQPSSPPGAKSAQSSNAKVHPPCTHYHSSNTHRPS